MLLPGLLLSLFSRVVLKSNPKITEEMWPILVNAATNRQCGVGRLNPALLWVVTAWVVVAFVESCYKLHMFSLHKSLNKVIETIWDKQWVSKDSIRLPMRNGYISKFKNLFLWLSMCQTNMFTFLIHFTSQFAFLLSKDNYCIKIHINVHLRF